MGPDADLYRDPSTGLILDASEQGTTITSFTSHRSPLGLVFDNEGVLPEPYTGDALMLSWTGSESPLLGPFEGEGEDLLHLEISLSTDPPSMQVTRIATHFINPIDASLIGDKLYVLEFGGGARLLELRFVSSVEVEQPQRLEVARVEIFPNPARGRTQFWIRDSRRSRGESNCLMFRVVSSKTLPLASNKRVAMPQEYWIRLVFHRESIFLLRGFSRVSQASHLW